MKINWSEFLFSFFIFTLPFLIFSYLSFFQIIAFYNWLNWTLGIITGILSIPVLQLAFIDNEKESYSCVIFQFICLEFLFFTAPLLKAYCWMLTSILLSIYLLLSLISLIICRSELKKSEQSSRDAWYTANSYRNKVEAHDAIARKIKDSLR